MKARYEQHNGLDPETGMGDRDVGIEDDGFDESLGDRDDEGLDDDGDDSCAMGREEWVVAGDETPGSDESPWTSHDAEPFGDSDDEPLACVEAPLPEEEWERSALSHTMSSRDDPVNRNPPIATPVVESIPRMPRVEGHDGSKQEPHRAKFIASPLIGLAMVARPVGKTEVAKNPEARASMDKEWSRLIQQGVWDVSSAREKDDVAAEARRDGKDVQFGRLYGICVEKNPELEKGHPSRKFRGRVVFLGNQVTNQFYESASFQDLGNSPATMEAARFADCIGCAPEHTVQMADAVQAYVQADLGGDSCWVTLPPEIAPKNGPWTTMRKPVVRLVKALCGHPDSGTFWEKHCDTCVRSVGFRNVGPDWPSVYIHEELKLFLVIYVDDFKLAGPAKNIAGGWKLLRTRLGIDPETPLGHYLGCDQRMIEAVLHDGTKVRRVVYDMKSFMQQCVERYLVVAGQSTKLKKVGTPFLADSGTEQARQGGSASLGQFVCPTCRIPFSPTEEGSDITADGWVFASVEETAVLRNLPTPGGGNRRTTNEWWVEDLSTIRALHPTAHNVHVDVAGESTFRSVHWTAQAGSNDVMRVRITYVQRHENGKSWWERSRRPTTYAEADNRDAYLPFPAESIVAVVTVFATEKVTAPRGLRGIDGETGKAC